MQIVCPSCSSAYELDAAKLGPAGRKVRCANCRTQWHVEPVFPEAPSPDETQALLDAELQRGFQEEAPESAAEGDVPPAQDTPAPDAPVAQDTHPPDPPAAPPRRHRGKSSKPHKRRSPHRAVSVPAALALAGASILALMIWQSETSVRLAPQLAGLFEALGRPVNIRGLGLSAIESGLVEDPQGRFLVVEGDVTNITKRNKPVPLIEVAVKDAAGQTLYTWTTEPPRQSLEPAELVRFRARLAAPPDTGRAVTVRFSDAKPVKQADAKPARDRP
jgi:predicted Zn finger-like uncharacterized protein